MGEINNTQHQLYLESSSSNRGRRFETATTRATRLPIWSDSAVEQQLTYFKNTNKSINILKNTNKQEYSVYLHQRREDF